MATIIYLHRISDNRMTGSDLDNLHMFTILCGQQVMPHVVITTTMWTKVTMEEGEVREGELKRKFWKDMMAGGCRIERFKDTHDSAWSIIDGLARNHRTQVALPRESVGIDLRLHETRVSTNLTKELERLIEDHKHAARGLRTNAGIRTVAWN
jgi:hypothetical protein